MSALKKNYPNPEVSPKPQKRKLSPEYKRRILEEAAACEHGELGALLRREGLYYSSLAAHILDKANSRVESSEAIHPDTSISR